MAQLVIDIGNSRTKLALFHGRSLIKLDKVEKLNLDILSRYFQNTDITHSIISSVNDEISILEDFLKEKTE
jgi:type III pantothenate kinase